MSTQKTLETFALVEEVRLGQQIAEALAQLDPEVMQAAAAPDSTAPRTPNPAYVRALLQHIRTLRLPYNSH